ncbi:MAG: leucine-rich repeat domain-containing protein [Psychrosphaera sp.]|nr:leucine-rich repeat domain-containing protein [Psychrosphaera sp.]
MKYLLLVLLLVAPTLKAQDWQTLMRHQATTSLEQALKDGDKTQFLHIKKTTLTQAQLQSIGKLKNLKVLRLNKTGISGLGKWLYQLENLQVLDLSFNNLTTFNPDLSKLKSLQFLSLNGNKLGALPQDFDQLINLKLLTLNNNFFSDVPPAIRKMKGLEKVMLTGNALVAIIPKGKYPFEVVW